MTSFNYTTHQQQTPPTAHVLKTVCYAMSSALIYIAAQQTSLAQATIETPATTNNAPTANAPTAEAPANSTGNAPTTPTEAAPATIPTSTPAATPTATPATPANNASNVSTSATGDDIVVTASRQPQTLKTAISHTTVISRKQIEQSGANNIFTVLRQEAGFEFYQSGGQGTLSAIYLRGSNPNQTLIMLDGVPLTSENLDGRIRLEHIPLDQVDHIEVVRGNVSALYGSQAMGGVIQIFTRQASAALQTNASISASSHHGSSISTGIAGKQQYFNYSLQVTGQHTAGFSSMNPASNQYVNPDKDGYRNRSINLKLGYTPTSTQELGVQTQIYSTKTDYDNPYSSFSTPEKDTQYETVLNRFTSVFYRVAPNDHWQSKLSFNVTREHREDFNRVAEDIPNEDKRTFGLLTRQAQWQLHNDIYLAPEHKLQLGADRTNSTIETETPASMWAPGTSFDHSRRHYDVYLGYQGEFQQQLSWQTQFRYDKHQENPGNTSRLFGLRYEPIKGVSFFGKYATAFSAPTLSQLFDPNYGNFALRPEKSHSRELGLQYNDKYQLWRATFFNTRYQDLFSYNPDTFQNINIGSARNQGVELTGEIRFNAINFKAGLTFQRPEDRSTSEPELLLRRAKKFGHVGVAYDATTWGVNTNLQFSGPRTDSVYNESTFKNERVQLAGYTTMQIGAYYALTPELKLKASLENAFNRKYEFIKGYNTQPRTWMISIHWQQSK